MIKNYIIWPSALDKKDHFGFNRELYILKIYVMNRDFENGNQSEEVKIYRTLIQYVMAELIVAHPSKSFNNVITYLNQTCGYEIFDYLKLVENLVNKYGKDHYEKIVQLAYMIGEEVYRYTLRIQPPEMTNSEYSEDDAFNIDKIDLLPVMDRETRINFLKKLRASRGKTPSERAQEDQKARQRVLYEAQRGAEFDVNKLRNEQRDAVIRTGRNDYSETVAMQAVSDDCEEKNFSHEFTNYLFRDSRFDSQPEEQKRNMLKVAVDARFIDTNGIVAEMKKRVRRPAMAKSVDLDLLKFVLERLEVSGRSDVVNLYSRLVSIQEKMA